MVLNYCTFKQTCEQRILKHILVNLKKYQFHLHVVIHVNA